VGRVGVLRVPEGPNVRFDGGIREGQAITPAFDPMLAKLIVMGETREKAVQELQHALQNLVLLGVPTNIDYLARIARHPQFAAGQLHTGFLTLHAQDLASPPRTEEAHPAVLAALFAGDEFRRMAFEVPEPHASIGYWRN
jgi:propionyl-CoA carboxylase alpha chain/3-methylcrotonyl-CoA carboxylase alpha subunit/acetyl-CoA/propionyl-CoA carboxylase biotin carboxyl carrier protein